MPDQLPTVGRIVHYVSHGTPVRGDGTQAYTPECRAAVVTEVTGTPDNPGQVALAVLNPTGVFLDRAVPYDDDGETAGAPDCPDTATHGSPFRDCACGWMQASYRGGTWHWPERQPTPGPQPARVGELVLYTVTEGDANDINRRRQDARTSGSAEERTGFVMHFGNSVREGDVYPAVIVRTFAEGSVTCNLQVLLDGSDTYWATSRQEGDGPSRWTRQERA